MRQDERLVREAGCEAYMSKPIQMGAFINEVKKLTGPRTTTPGRTTPPTSTPPRRMAR
jgi:two-component system cell cycle response regulator DivK